MNCPKCRRDTAVTKTIRSIGFVLRERECECGVAFTTEEKLQRGGGLRSIRGVYRRPITVEMRLEVLARSKGQCHYCGTTYEVGIDHKIALAAPLQDGESREQATEYRNSIDNLVACCKRCNSSKGAKTPEQFTGQVPQGAREKGEEIDSGSVLSLVPPDPNPDVSDLPERARVRGKARVYTEEFEAAWKLYGRKDEKFSAFEAWLNASKQIGGESELLARIRVALKWQTPIWASDGWKYAPYFQRYLKRRKWEDEKPPAPVAYSPQREIERERSDRLIEATNRKAAEYAAWVKK